MHWVETVSWIPFRVEYGRGAVFYVTKKRGRRLLRGRGLDGTVGNRLLQPPRQCLTGMGGPAESGGVPFPEPCVRASRITPRVSGKISSAVGLRAAVV